MMEQYFKSGFFQIKWRKYKKLFGEDLDYAFGNNYDKKIRLAKGLDLLANKKYNDAYNEIRHLVQCCENENDINIINRIIKICYNEEEMSKVKEGDWVKESSSGYYKVIKKEHDKNIIKEGFDSELIFAKDSHRMSKFYIQITDLKTFQFVEKKEVKKIKNFFTVYSDKENEFLKYTEAMLKFRNQILKSNLKEAKYDFRQFHFYYIVSDKVAFILNLDDLGNCIKITYGYTNIQDYKYLEQNGEDNSYIKIRFQGIYKNDGDEKEIINNIKDVYETYFNKTKDEILSLRKLRQKEFINKINEYLKPLNFKKKNTNWTRVLEQNYCLKFELQKSQWSDQYYFNININKLDENISTCFTTRIISNGTSIYNWQLMSDYELNELMSIVINDFIMPIVNTPLKELGKQKEFHIGCFCNRKKCENCWIEKNCGGK